MYQTIAEQAFYRLLATTLLFLAGAGSACADSLSVNEAEQLAARSQGFDNVIKFRTALNAPRK